MKQNSNDKTLKIFPILSTVPLSIFNSLSFSLFVMLILSVIAERIMHHKNASILWKKMTRIVILTTGWAYYANLLYILRSIDWYLQYLVTHYDKRWIALFIIPTITWYCLIRPVCHLIIVTISAINWNQHTLSHINSIRAYLRPNVTRSWRTSLIFTMLACVVILMTYQSKSISFTGRWEKTQDISCQSDLAYKDAISLILISESAPNFEIRVCTSGAEDFLSQQNENNVAVKIRVHYLVFQPIYYSVQEINDWQGSIIKQPFEPLCIYHNKTRATGCVRKTSDLDEARKQIFGYFQN